MDRHFDFVKNFSTLVLLSLSIFGANQLMIVSGVSIEKTFLKDWFGNIVLAKEFDSSENMSYIIDDYLESKNSPLSGTGRDFVASAEKYQIPVDLMVAMTGAESNFAKEGYAIEGTYNPVGLGIHEGRRYSSWSDGIDDMARVLRNYYFDEGRTDPVSIQNKWAPRCVDGNGCDNSWADNVKYFMGELETWKK